MSLSPGTRLGPYAIVAPLGAGGMGEVYRARDSRLDREVAIKILPPHLAADPEALSRFEREAKAVAALSHPGILAIYDFDTQAGQAYAVTELLDGQTVRERLGAGPLPVGEATDIAIQAARGLGAAHARDLVHRDVKPENLFLTRDGRLKVLDFGLARASAPGATGGAGGSTVTQLTAPGAVLGTFAYMSPEQIRGEPVDARSDIFSLGLVLHEMLTGRHAFPGATPTETMAAILRDEVSDTGFRARAVPDALRAVVRRCLAKTPAARFQTMQDLALVLEATRRSPDGPSSPTSALRSMQGLSYAAVVLVAAGLIVWFGIGHSRSRAGRSSTTPSTARTIAVLPFLNMSGDQDNAYFSDGITEEILNALTHVPGLQVAARTSAFQFKGAGVDLREAGRKLGVANILEGSVQRAGDEVRITAQLIDAETGYHRWSEKYDRKLESVFAVEDEISRAIASALQLQLASGGTPAPRSKAATTSVEAHDLYLRGHALLLKASFESLNAALDDFRRAIAVDSTYALAWTGIAETYQVLADGYLAPNEVIPKSEAAARRAAALDDALPEAHVLLGNLWQWNLDQEEALREQERALALDPNNLTGLQWHGLYLAVVGPPERALEELDRVLARDPLNPLVYYMKGFAYAAMNDGQGMLDAAARVEQFAPDFFYYDSMRGMGYRMLGRWPEAVAEYRRIQPQVDMPLFGLAVSLTHVGQAAEARQILAQLEERAIHQYVPPDAIAAVYAALGDKDQAFVWLNRAVDAHSATFIGFIASLPDYQPLRSDPRYVQLLQRVKVHLPAPRP